MIYLRSNDLQAWHCHFRGGGLSRWNSPVPNENIDWLYLLLKNRKQLG